jgi:hypothetical protein
MFFLDRLNIRPEKVESRSLPQDSSLEEQTAPFLGHPTELENGPIKRDRSAKRYLYLNISLFLLSVVFFFGSVTILARGPTDTECVTHMSAYCT